YSAASPRKRNAEQEIRSLISQSENDYNETVCPCGRFYEIRERLGMPKNEFVSAAEEAALAAGRILQDWAGRFTVSEKGPADLVTEADLASQTAIHQILSGRYPDHAFLGEEGLRSSPGGTEYRWIIDPLDGTSNYV